MVSYGVRLSGDRRRTSERRWRPVEKVSRIDEITLPAILRSHQASSCAIGSRFVSILVYRNGIYLRIHTTHFRPLGPCRTLKLHGWAVNVARTICHGLNSFLQQLKKLDGRVLISSKLKLTAKTDCIVGPENIGRTGSIFHHQLQTPDGDRIEQDLLLEFSTLVQDIIRHLMHVNCSCTINVDIYLSLSPMIG